MNIPSPPVFSQQDNPNLDTNFLGQLTQSFETLHNTLAVVPRTGGATGLSFLTNASGAGYVDVKPDFEVKPTDHAWVTNVVLSTGSLSQPFSVTWSLVSGGNLRFAFVGLPASVKAFASVKYESSSQ